VNGELPPDANQTREADIQSVLAGVELVKNVKVKVKFGCDLSFFRDRVFFSPMKGATRMFLLPL